MINIFEKRVVFLPICQDNHWTLCVIVNPGGAIEALAYPDDPILSQRKPCMILMNSLKNSLKKAKVKDVQETVLFWLNREWERIVWENNITGPWKTTIQRWIDWKKKNLWTSDAFVVDKFPMYNPNGNVQVNV